MKYEVFDNHTWQAHFQNVTMGSCLDLNELEPSVEQVRRVKQVHGAQIVDDATYNNDLNEGDGLISSDANTALVISTADCVPVHLTDGHHIGVVHAGWRGTAAGIVKNLARFFKPSKVVAFIGPSISAPNYEVDSDLYLPWSERESNLMQWLLPSEKGGSKRHLDLRGFIAHQLVQCGISRDRTVTIPICTYDSSLPSYRRNGTAKPGIYNYIYKSA